MGSIPVRVIKKLLNLRIEELFLCKPFGSYESEMSTVVAAAWAHMREGVFLFDPYGNQ